MKAKFSTLIFLLSIVLGALICSSAKAQDEGFSSNDSQEPNHQELNASEDRTTLFEHESKLKSANRDSAQIHAKPPLTTTNPAKSKPSDHKPSNGREEDDALSFNFLYYIIQKFKISDLIDN
jgi:hypothetical protein